jgi:hypothetical protein
LNDNLSDTQNSKTWIIFHYNMKITVAWKVCYQISVVHISCLVESGLGCTQSGALQPYTVRQMQWQIQQARFQRWPRFLSTTYENSWISRTYCQRNQSQNRFQSLRDISATCGVPEKEQCSLKVNLETSSKDVAHIEINLCASQHN